MGISIQIMQKQKTIESILDFQTDSMPPFWREPLFKCYPFLDKEKGFYPPFQIRKDYLTQALSHFYTQNYQAFLEKQKLFFEHLKHNQKQLLPVFNNIFNIDCKPIFDTTLIEISLNPICPRYLNEKRFTIFFKFGPEQFLNTVIHELIHFVWFFIWQKHFNDSSNEYESPHLKWILSEMVVDTLVKNTELNQFYKARGNETPAYSYFYDMHIQNKPVLDTLSLFFKQSKEITLFMEKAFQYILTYENEIRKQMP